jgi:hypothetical protein
LGTAPYPVQHRAGRIVIAVFWSNWPDSTSYATMNSLELLFVLAVLANVTYCAAYLADVVAQSSTLGTTWLRFRWVVLSIGVIFAGILTHFFALKLFGDAV